MDFFFGFFKFFWIFWTYLDFWIFWNFWNFLDFFWTRVVYSTYILFVKNCCPTTYPCWPTRATYLYFNIDWYIIYKLPTSNCHPWTKTSLSAVTNPSWSLIQLIYQAWSHWKQNWWHSETPFIWFLGYYLRINLAKVVKK